MWVIVLLFSLKLYFKISMNLMHLISVFLAILHFASVFFSF